MKVSIGKLESWLTTLNDIKGFPQKFLEDHLHQLSKEGYWETFMDFLALDPLWNSLVFQREISWIKLQLMLFSLSKTNSKILSQQFWLTHS